MTTSRYILARVAMAFGINRRQYRMGEAASETHLLREAEQVLGERIWDRVEDIEELGIEYWNLRRLVTDRDRLREELAKHEELLTNAHDHRANLLGEKSDKQDELENERKELISQLEELARERDAVVTKARDVRRVYDGLKTKLDVLKEEHREDDEVVEKTRSRMLELREAFEDLKLERDRIAKDISNFDEQLTEAEKRIKSERDTHREDASVSFQQIGDANRAISELKAELGVIRTKMLQLFGEIGRHVSRNIDSSQECRKAVRDNRPLVEVMSALRKSINLNHRLAGN